MKKLLIVIAGLTIIGCHSNPYGGVDGEVTTDPVKEKPSDPKIGFFCDVPDRRLHMKENQTPQPLTLSCRVPAGEPKIQFENLPAWITFDPAHPEELTLAPGPRTGYDPATPADMQRDYLFIVHLSSTDKSMEKTVVPFKITVTVHHELPTMEIRDFEPNVQVFEGETYKKRFKVINPDFPDGIFTISSTKLPPGVTITKTGDPKIFEIAFTPPANAVKLGETREKCWNGGTNYLCIKILWDLNVIDPRGSMKSVSGNWQILDKRNQPLVVAPKTVITYNRKAQFYVQVEDPNGEVIPAVNAPNKSEGTVFDEEVAKSPAKPNQNPYMMKKFEWTFDKAKRGDTKVIYIHSCVNDNNNYMDNCVDTPVEVTLK